MRSFRGGRRPWRTAAWLASMAAILAASPALGVPDVLDRPALMSRRAPASVLTAVTRAARRLVAVGEHGIVLTSDDEGASWQQALVPVSVTLTNVTFVGAEWGWAVGHSGVILRSADGGRTWLKQLDGRQIAPLMLRAAQTGGELAEAHQLAAEGPDKPFLGVHFQDRAHGLVVGAYGLIFATQDGGRTWVPWQTHIDNPNRYHLNCIESAGADMYIAGEQGGVYRSTDGGVTFARLTTPYKGSYFGALAESGGRLLVYGLRGNAYRSADYGRSWARVEMGVPVSLTAGVVRPDGSIVLVNQGGGAFLSDNHGETFRALRVEHPFPFTGLAETPAGALVASGVRGTMKIAAPPSHAERTP